MPTAGVNEECSTRRGDARWSSTQVDVGLPDPNPLDRAASRRHAFTDASITRRNGGTSKPAGLARPLPSLCPRHQFGT